VASVVPLSTGRRSIGGSVVRYRPGAVGLLVVSAFVLLQACADEPVRLTQPGGDPDGWFGMTFSEVGPGAPILLTSEVNLCLDGPGSVEIIDVTVKEVEGSLVVEDFAIRPARGSFPDWEDDDQTLGDVGFVPGERTVQTVCPVDVDDASLDDFVKLGVQFTKSAVPTARGSGLAIHYTVDGDDQRVFEVPFGLVLCEGQTTDSTGELTEDCDHIEDDYYVP